MALQPHTIESLHENQAPQLDHLPYTPYDTSCESREIATPNGELSLIEQNLKALESRDLAHYHNALEYVTGEIEAILLHNLAKPNEIFPSKDSYLKALDHALEQSLQSLDQPIAIPLDQEENQAHTLDPIQPSGIHQLAAKLIETILVENGAPKAHSMTIDNLINLDTQSLLKAKDLVQIYRSHIETNPEKAKFLEIGLENIELVLNVKDLDSQIVQFHEDSPELELFLSNSLAYLKNELYYFSSEQGRYPKPLVATYINYFNIKQRLFPYTIDENDQQWLEALNAHNQKILDLKDANRKIREQEAAVRQSVQHIEDRPFAFGPHDPLASENPFSFRPTEQAFPRTIETLKKIIQRADETGQTPNPQGQLIVAEICDIQLENLESQLCTAVSEQDLDQAYQLAKKILKISHTVRAKYAPDTEPTPHQDLLTKAQTIIDRKDSFENYKNADHQKVWQAAENLMRTSLLSFNPILCKKLSEIYNLKTKHESDLPPEDYARAQVLTNLTEAFIEHRINQQNPNPDAPNPFEDFFLQNFTQLQLLGLHNDIASQLNIAINAPHQSLPYGEGKITELSPTDLMPGNVIAITALNQHTSLFEVSDKTVPHYNHETRTITLLPVLLKRGTECILPHDYFIGDTFKVYSFPATIDASEFHELGSCPTAIGLEVYENNTGVKEIERRNNLMRALRDAYKEKQTLSGPDDPEAPQKETYATIMKISNEKQRAISINTARKNDLAFDHWFQSFTHLQKMMEKEQVII